MKWPNDADAPVLFFIDDLCNKWIDINEDGILSPENDWGHGGLSENGVYRYLENEILSINPEIKVTFFIPVGERAPIILNSPVRSYSFPMNHSQKSKDFFSYIHNETPHALAYHGITHGIPDEKASDFIQEWLSYQNLDAAINTINKGKELFKDTIGEYPKGGKYCGYHSNHFSNESVVKTGFDWWCRYYNRGLETIMEPFFTGKDKNPLTNFQIKGFGEKIVTDIPTTIHGDLFNPLKTRNPIKQLKGFIKEQELKKKKIDNINFLLENNLVISIQEHISPSREDGRRQTPNIFDDLQSLIKIFEYLRDKNVWYCTGSEIAEWVKNNGS